MPPMPAINDDARFGTLLPVRWESEFHRIAFTSGAKAKLKYLSLYRAARGNAIMSTGTCHIATS